MATKIATCCYCGTRAALVLCGKTRHELSCGNCGAPLHEMKALRVQHKTPQKTVVKTRVKDKKPKKTPHKSRKKIRSFSPKRAIWHLLDEAWDVVEDIFD